MFRSGNTRNRNWLALLIWIAVIFFFSTDSFSADRSSGFIVPILTFLFPGMSETDISFWHVVIRKSGHVFEYFILGVLAFRAFRVDQRSTQRVVVAGALLVVAIASIDEFHQSWTLMRSASLIDVGYDCLGGFAALAAFAFWT